MLLRVTSCDVLSCLCKQYNMSESYRNVFFKIDWVYRNHRCLLSLCSSAACFVSERVGCRGLSPDKTRKLTVIRATTVLVCVCLRAKGGLGLKQGLFSAIVLVILRGLLVTPLSCSHNVVLLVWSEIERTGGWNSVPTCAHSISSAAACILYHALSSYCIARVLD